MTTPRIILSSISPADKIIPVTERNLNYLRNVLRIAVGDEVIVLDGLGLSFSTIVTELKKDHILLERLEDINPDTESHLKLLLIQGILKSDRMDTAIQKSTELGVTEIFPVITERSQLRYTRKVDHWRRVAEEATRQCGRVIVPILHDPCMLEDLYTGLDRDGIRIIFHESADKSVAEVFNALKNDSSDLSAVPYQSSIYYLIGPEGGFSVDEVKTAKSNGFNSVWLGKRVMRAETAAIAAATLLQFHFGDFR